MIRTRKHRFGLFFVWKLLPNVFFPYTLLYYLPLQITADISIEDAVKEDWDLVALPGGMPGTFHIAHPFPFNELRPC